MKEKEGGANLSFPPPHLVVLHHRVELEAVERIKAVARRQNSLCRYLHVWYVGGAFYALVTTSARMVGLLRVEGCGGC